jgi:hypothetical protein
MPSLRLPIPRIHSFPAYLGATRVLDVAWFSDCRTTASAIPHALLLIPLAMPPIADQWRRSRQRQIECNVKLPNRVANSKQNISNPTLFYLHE